MCDNISSDTYVAQRSFESEGEEIDWGQVQDGEHTGKLAQQTKPEHERLPDEEEEPENETEVKDGLHSRKHEEVCVLGGERRVWIIHTGQVVAHVDKDDVAREEDVESHEDEEGDDLL